MVTSLLQTLAGLPHLAELELGLSKSAVGLPPSFPCMTSLRRLSVSITYSDSSRHLPALIEAAAQGITIALHVYLECGFDASEEEIASYRAALWATLAELSRVDSLQLQSQDCYCRDWATTSREEQLLANVRCKELVLHNGFWQPCGQCCRHNCPGIVPGTI